MVRRDHCGYDAPDDPFVETILNQNIKGERCAIGFYKKLLEATQGKDPVTYNIVLQILQDEVAHEEDLQSLSEDLGHDDEEIALRNDFCALFFVSSWFDSY